MMEITNIKLPEGFEAKFEGKTLVITKAEEKLDTWGKCIKYLSDLEYINNDCEIREIKISNTNLSNADYDLIPKGEGKKLLAFMRLIVCRNAWYKKYDSYPSVFTVNYGIQRRLKSQGFWLYCNNINISTLSFNNEKIRDRFYETFKDLIEQARDLI